MSTTTAPAADAATTIWQQTIADQLAELDDNAGVTHLVVHLDADGEPTLIDRCDSETAAIVSAADHATRLDGEVTVIAARDLPQPDREPALHPDPDTGKLFDVPRITVIADDADPTLLKVAFAGAVDIERGDKQWVAFYNQLRAGKTAEITVTVHVAGAKKTHRRDKEGDVDAIVETKSLVVTDLHLENTEVFD